MMKTIDILCGDVLFAEMLKCELEARGYKASTQKSTAPDLIICDLDAGVSVKGPFVLTFSRDKDADLHRPFDTERLLALIDERLSDKNESLAKEEKRKGLYLSPYERGAFYNEEKIELSELEYRLLLYLYNNKKASIDELSREVFGEKSNPNLVRVYINYLREKIDSRFSVRLIKTKRGYGYILGGATENDTD